MSETLRSVLDRKWGVATTTQSSKPGDNIGGGSQVIFKQNGNRLAAVFVNLSALNVFLAPLLPATTAFGIWIPPYGGSLVLLADEDFDLTGYEWQGITDTIGGGAAYLSLEVLTAPGKS